MAAKPLTEREKIVLRQIKKNLTFDQLCKELKMNYRKVNGFITSLSQKGMVKRNGSNIVYIKPISNLDKVRKYLTDQQIQYIHDQHYILPRRKLAEHLGISKTTLNFALMDLNLCKEEAEYELLDDES